MNAPLLAIVIMVKNEEKAIENTLMPFVRAGVLHMCIFDTGSTDNTIEVTKTFFKTHNISGYIDQEPFVDFATSRNRALEFQKTIFQMPHFFFMPDADWYLQNVGRLIEFCENEKSKTEPLYNMKVKLDHWEYYSSRLFRVSAQNRYVGVVRISPRLLPKAKI